MKCLSFTVSYCRKIAATVGLLFLFVCGYGTTSTVHDATYTVGSVVFTYDAEGNDATITNISFLTVDPLIGTTIIVDTLTIPATFTNGSNTYSVRDIKGHLTTQWMPWRRVSVFGEVETSNTTIAAINFPNTLTSISDFAFVLCDALTSLTLPEGLKTVGKGAFADCSNLYDVQFPTSLTTIGTSAFDNCKRLTSIIDLSQTYLTSIGKSAFEKCVRLKTVKLPESLISIGGSAFWQNTALTNINFPSSLTYLGQFAFYECTSLVVADLSKTKVVNFNWIDESEDAIPRDWTDLPMINFNDGGQFQYCSSLTKITLPSVFNELGGHYPYFNGCTALNTFIFLNPVPPIVTHEYSNPLGLNPNTNYTVYVLHSAVGAYRAGDKWSSIGNRIQPIPNTLTLTLVYNANGGIGLLPDTVFFLDSCEVPEPDFTLTRSGYVFDGWYNDAFGGTKYTTFPFTITDSTTLHAHWNPIVTYNANGGIGVHPFDTVAYGAILTAPDPAPTLVGYTFGEWHTHATNNALYDFSLPVTAPFTLYAHWNIRSYDITYDTNGGTGGPNDTQALYNTPLSKPNLEPTRDGYAFNGWWTLAEGGFLHTFPITVTRDFTLHAQWIKLHAITYNANGGSGYPKDTTVRNGYILKKPTTHPVNIGTIFDGWWNRLSGGTLLSFPIVVTSDTTLYAHWSQNCNSYFYANKGEEGEVPKLVTLFSGYTLNPPAPAPTREYYTLNGWWDMSVGGTQYTFPLVVTTGLTLYAHWIGLPQPVTFYINGGSFPPANTTIPCGSPLPEPEVPVPLDGYTFDGWYNYLTGGTRYDFPLTITGPTYLYAHYTFNQYSITFDTNGGSSATTSQTVNHGTVVEPITEPTRPNYTFGGWYTHPLNNTPYDFATLATASLTLYAHWTPLITFDANGGTLHPSTSPEQQVSYGALIPELIAAPTRPHSICTGWFTEKIEGNKWNFSSDKVTTGLTLYAHWEGVPQGITYNINGIGSIPNTYPASIPYDSTLTAPSPALSYAGYTFDGWYTQATYGTQYTFPIRNITAPLTLYAHWTALPQDIIYNCNGGTGGPTTTTLLTNRQLYTPKPEPVPPTGYALSGWYDHPIEGQQYIFPFTITGPTYLYAHYTLINCLVTYNLNGGSGGPSSSSSVAYGQTLSQPATPFRNGYIFDGWDVVAEGGTRCTFPLIITSPLTLYAHWKAESYLITFDANGGTLYTTSLQANHDALIPRPTNPTRPGYIFLGWFTMEEKEWNFDSDKIAGALALTARWDVAYTVTFAANAGTDSNVSLTPAQTVRQGAKVTIPTTPLRNGYTFNDWYIDYDGSERWNFNTGLTGNLTLYAFWNLNTYQVTFKYADGVNADYTVRDIEHGDYLQQPPSPVRNGYTFSGWYSNTTGGTQWDFVADAVTRSVILYAHWTSTLSSNSTGIDALPVSTGDGATYYDLQGRRVLHPEIGRLYIIIYGNGERRLTVSE